MVTYVKFLSTVNANDRTSASPIDSDQDLSICSIDITAKQNINKAPKVSSVDV